VRGVPAHPGPDPRLRSLALAPPVAWLAAAGQPTQVLLLRHGQTEMSVQKRYAGSTDVPLNDTGMAQADAAARRLAGAGLDAIVSSPLLRTRQTAARVAARCGLPVEVDDGFRETDFGQWEALTFAEVRERWPDELTRWLADPLATPPGAENFADATARVLAALGRLLAAHAGRRVLVVSHVGPIKTLICSVLGAPPSALFRMHLDTAALCTADWFPDGPALLRSYNDTAHLSDSPAAAGG
jgi:ribonuclease H / adenosylcobalamin/alpha-ribazole phosphatase